MLIPERNLQTAPWILSSEERVVPYLDFLQAFENLMGYVACCCSDPLIGAYMMNSELKKKLTRARTLD